MGCSQVERQSLLMRPFGGSNPSTPEAKIVKLLFTQKTTEQIIEKNGICSKWDWIPHL